jgi:uncharacterized membrane protein
MTPVLVVAAVTVFAAALETVIRYVRLHHITAWSQRSALVGAIFWGVALIIFQLNRTALSTPTTILTSIVGGVVWYVVALLLGRSLWRSAGGSAKR